MAALGVLLAQVGGAEGAESQIAEVTEGQRGAERVTLPRVGAGLRPTHGSSGARDHKRYKWSCEGAPDPGLPSIHARSRAPHPRCHGGLALQILHCGPDGDVDVT